MADSNSRSRAQGTLWGQAVGDALGLATEFLTAAQARSHYPNGVQDFSGYLRDEHRSRWTQGAWTDDTDQMICVLRSLSTCGRADPVDVGRRIQAWVHGGGMGVGAHTWRVVNWSGYEDDPIAMAFEAWDCNGRRSEANGAVMRTSVVGVWAAGDLNAAAADAALLATTTHPAPGSVAAAVVVSVAVAHLIVHCGDVDGALAAGIDRARAIDPRVEDAVARAIAATTIADLQLDADMSSPNNRIGHAYTTLAAGVYALRHAPTWWDGVQAVVMAGGDADTNAAVAGALLGARDGVGAIPFGIRASLSRSEQFGALVDSFVENAIEKLER